MHRVGIESDQLVYDYLSRVGDLAQQQQLSSGARMRLVSTLRGEIDRRRASEGADSPAAVRRIIGRLGSPAELVSAAAESGDGSVPLPSARTGGGAGLPRPRSGFLRKSPKEPEVPEAPDEPRPASGPASGPVPDPGPKAGSWRGASRWGAGGGTRAGSGRSGDADAGRAEARFRTETGYASDSRTDFTKSTGPDEDLPADPTPWPHPSAPHVLGPDQQSSDDEWWRLEPGPFDAGTAIPGFFGGIEAPELLGRRPQKPDAADKEEEGDGLDAEDTEEGDGTDEQEPRRALRIPRPRRRKPVAVAEPVVAAAPARRGGFAHPLLLLAAVLLIAGVVTGSWIPLAGGWLIAYGSRTLSRTEAKWAALGLPGVVVAGALVWVWGRVDGRWGEPIEDGALREVLVGAWPVVVRVAAVASALYLVWRARRRA
ncbi:MULTISPECIES: hypothetical protein [unclassified Streptomyces]|uniref:hypothetical protein n=1 Tax=unclassified Streptomyces TaxID=2593676 RepID=UPI00081E0FB4|nr:MULTISPECIES: hypothetical protein [unclassified Streptomyces]MYR98024.1 hypothetical protein [Streptomyces sp. SID4937]SCE33031.1 hypothetical protein GA0115243_1106106 [Streptomyces sp. ScaeMP-e83]